jgi:hypothetical protein
MESIGALAESSPVLEAVLPAHSMGTFADLTVRHAGPPLDPGRIPPVLASAVAGALTLEGVPFARAQQLVADGKADLRPNHDVGIVGPLAGVVTGSTPVLVVRDEHTGRRAAAPMTEGPGLALRFGATEPEVLKRLRWMRSALAPALNARLQRAGPIPLLPIMAAALDAGDELHNSSTTARDQLLATIGVSSTGSASDPVGAFLATNPHFFMSIAMAAAKCATDAAHEAATPGIVTAMSANGESFGIRVAGLADRWYLAPATPAQGRLADGISPGSAAPVIGDSFITETVGLGAASGATNPVLATYLGTSEAKLQNLGEQMRDITRGTHPRLRVRGRGIPLGFDVRLVCASGVVPVMNAGIASAIPGAGQIGAGVFRAPIECFQQAVDDLNRSSSGHEPTHEVTP